MAERCFCGTVLRENGLPCQHCGNQRPLRASNQQGQSNSGAPLSTPETSLSSSNSRCPPKPSETLQGNLDVRQQARTRRLSHSEPVGGDESARNSSQSSLPETTVDGLAAYSHEMYRRTQDVMRSRQRIQQLRRIQPVSEHHRRLLQQRQRIEQQNMEQRVVSREGTEQLTMRRRTMLREKLMQQDQEALRRQQEQPVMSFQRKVRFADNHLSEIPRSNHNSISGEPSSGSQQATDPTRTSQQSAQRVQANIPCQPTQASDLQHTVEVSQAAQQAHQNDQQAVMKIEIPHKAELPATPSITDPVPVSDVTDASQPITCLAEEEDANKEGCSNSEDEWILVDADETG